MGTHYSVVLAPPPDAATRDSLAALIAQRLEQINGEMSTYREDSSLSRFNRSTSTDWQAVPAALSDLVARANAISAQTEGAYDITVGPLVELWGFGASGRRDTPPPAAQIAARLAAVGFDKLEVRTQPPALRKRIPGLQVDLSSIAKGWAVDEIAALLDAHDIRGYLVEIGGDLVVRGDKGGGRPWRVAIERPLADRRAVQRIVALRDVAVATSGDYRNFFASGGQHYTHTIDPRTGHSVQHTLAAVTVFAGRAADADAWATALLALGDRDGPATAERAGIRALFVVRDAGGLREIRSSALQRAGLLGD